MVASLANILDIFNKKLQENLCLGMFFHKMQETQGDEYLNEVQNWSNSVSKWLKYDTKDKTASQTLQDALSAPGISRYIERIQTGFSNCVKLICTSIEFLDLHINEMDNDRKVQLMQEIQSAIGLAQNIVNNYENARVLRDRQITYRKEQGQNIKMEPWPDLMMGDIAMESVKDNNKFWNLVYWQKIYKNFAKPVQLNSRSLNTNLSPNSFIQ